jgi:hypothetical protein
MSSHAHTTTAPIGATKPRRRSLTAWIAGAIGLAVIVTAITIAVWPASAADKARDDGRAVGTAVSDLYYADSSAEAEQALADLDGAIAGTRDHAGDAVAQQAADQRDALSRAADGFVGSHTSESDWDVALYQSELDGALDDLTGNASDFRAEGPEVQQAFWQGVDDGLNGN